MRPPCRRPSAPQPTSLIGRQRKPQELNRETHLSASQYSPQAHPRLPCAHGHSARPQGAGRSSQARPQAARGGYRTQVMDRAGRPAGTAAEHCHDPVVAGAGEASQHALRTPPASDQGPAAQTLPRRLRIRQRRDFLRVQRSGTKIHTRFFLVFVAPSSRSAPSGASPTAPGDLPQTRLGVTVTRKVGKAVRRNRIKRLVREAFRRERHALPAGFDMVWVAKRDADGVAFEDVVLDMRALPARIRPRGSSTRARSR